MTTENNILMAEFMGMKPHDPKELDGFWTNTIKAHKFDNVMNLKFNSDWNWLMEVVKKCLIGEAEHSQDEAKKTISEIYESLCSINISAVYNACIEFIKWYNQQKN